MKELKMMINKEYRNCGDGERMRDVECEERRMKVLNDDKRDVTRKW